MIREHEPVILTRDLPIHALKSGDIGYVVHAYADGESASLENEPIVCTPQQAVNSRTRSRRA